MQNLSVSLPVINAKSLVKDSVITPAKATLTISQNGVDLFTRSTEGLNLSKSYATLSNIFHYQFKAHACKLDKYNPVTLTLTFGEDVKHVLTLQPKINSKGENVPYSSTKIGTALKTMYWQFAANILEDATVKGMYFNFIHGANSIARFTPSIEDAVKVAVKKATKAK